MYEPLSVPPPVSPASPASQGTPAPPIAPDDLDDLFSTPPPKPKRGGQQRKGRRLVQAGAAGIALGVATIILLVLAISDRGSARLVTGVSHAVTGVPATPPADVVLRGSLTDEWQTSTYPSDGESVWHVWDYAARPGDVATFYVRGLSDDLVPLVGLYDVTGERLATPAGRSSTDQQFSYIFTASRRYRLLVGRLGNAAGRYAVRVQVQR